MGASSKEGRRCCTSAKIPATDGPRLAQVFNLSGSEVIFLLLLALVILGPEKLPDFIRKVGRVYAEVRKMSTGFQTELRQAMDEPMRELRETAELTRRAVTFDPDTPRPTTPPKPVDSGDQPADQPVAQPDSQPAQPDSQPVEDDTEPDQDDQA